MVVDAVDQHGAAVDQQPTACDLDPAKAGGDGCGPRPSCRWDRAARRPARTTWATRGSMAGCGAPDAGRAPGVPAKCRCPRARARRSRRARPVHAGATPAPPGRPWWPRVRRRDGRVVPLTSTVASSPGVAIGPRPASSTAASSSRVPGSGGVEPGNGATSASEIHGPRYEGHTTVQPGQPPLVLVLGPLRGAPLRYDEPHGVAAGMEAPLISKVEARRLSLPTPTSMPLTQTIPRVRGPDAQYEPTPRQRAGPVHVRR